MNCNKCSEGKLQSGMQSYNKKAWFILVFILNWDLNYNLESTGRGRQFQTEITSYAKTLKHKEDPFKELHVPVYMEYWV